MFIPFALPAGNVCLTRDDGFKQNGEYRQVCLALWKAGQRKEGMGVDLWERFCEKKKNDEY